MKSKANAEGKGLMEPMRTDTWERRVFYSIPARFLRAAREELRRLTGVTMWTIYNHYLNGKYPNPMVRERFRELLKQLWEYYTERARREIEVEL